MYRWMYFAHAHVLEWPVYLLYVGFPVFFSSVAPSIILSIFDMILLEIHDCIYKERIFSGAVRFLPIIIPGRARYVFDFLPSRGTTLLLLISISAISLQISNCLCIFTRGHRSLAPGGYFRRLVCPIFLSHSLAFALSFSFVLPFFVRCF